VLAYSAKNALILGTRILLNGHKWASKHFSGKTFGCKTLNFKLQIVTLIAFFGYAGIIVTVHFQMEFINNNYVFKLNYLYLMMHDMCYPVIKNVGLEMLN
jgi:hypothetical protein